VATRKAAFLKLMQQQHLFGGSEHIFLFIYCQIFSLKIVYFQQFFKKKSLICKINEPKNNSNMTKNHSTFKIIHPILLKILLLWPGRLAKGKLMIWALFSLLSHLELLSTGERKGNLPREPDCSKAAFTFIKHCT